MSWFSHFKCSELLQAIQILQRFNFKIQFSEVEVWMFKSWVAQPLDSPVNKLW